MDAIFAMNRITLRGTITAVRISAKNRAVYTIATDGDKSNSVFPEVVHSVASTEEIWRVGENVTAICHGRSAKKMTEDGNPVYVKQIVADSIYKTERILSSYFENLPDDGGVSEDINEFIFCGEVYRVTVHPGGRNTVLVTLKITEGNNYSNYVEVAGFKNLADIMRSAKNGDTLAAAGAIRTIRKKNTVVFDYVAKDVYLQNKENDAVRHTDTEGDQRTGETAVEKLI